MSRFKGDKAEEEIVNFLEKKGFKIVERNYYIRGGEIDIIATKNGIYHFIEVKSGEGFEAVYNITPKKLQRVIKTANVYMKKMNIDPQYCFDAAIIQDETIEFIENITM